MFNSPPLTNPCPQHCIRRGGGGDNVVAGFSFCSICIPLGMFISMQPQKKAIWERLRAYVYAKSCIHCDSGVFVSCRGCVEIVRSLVHMVVASGKLKRRWTVTETVSPKTARSAAEVHRAFSRAWQQPPTPFDVRSKLHCASRAMN